MLTVAVLQFKLPLKRIYPGNYTLFGGNSPYPLLCLLQHYVIANKTKAKTRNGRKTKKMTTESAAPSKRVQMLQREESSSILLV